MTQSSIDPQSVRALEVEREDHAQVLDLATRSVRMGYWIWNPRTSEFDVHGLRQLFAPDARTLAAPVPQARLMDRVYEADRERVYNTLTNLMRNASTDVIDFDFRAIDPNGELRKYMSHMRRAQSPHTGEVKVYGVTFDITASELARTETLYRSELERLIVSISMQLSQAPLDELDRVINASLGEIGDYVGADRAYRFEYDWDAGQASNTHEWCAEGIEPQIGNLQHTDSTGLELLTSSHRHGLPFIVTDTESLPEQHALRELLVRQDIRSLATFPLFREDACFGFIGFDSVRAQHAWSSIEIALLELLAQLFSNADARRQREQALIETTAQLQASRDSAMTLAAIARSASEAKSRFVATISHEIRTPLHVMQGMIAELEATGLDPVQADYVKALVHSGRMLADLVADILDFSRIESGNVALTLTTFRLVDVLDQLDALLRPLAERKGIRITREVAPDVPEVLCHDPVRLTQILQNLLSNAVKFTEAGSVDLSVRRSRFGAEPRDDVVTLVFRVSDTGLGIDAATLERLYEPYFQGQPSPQAGLAGSGLGLTIVQNLVQLMQGSISVDSQPGVGTTFEVRLPMRTDSLPTETAQGASTGADGRAAGHGIGRLAGVAILAAEDNDLNRKVLETMLRDTGCRLTLVEDGRKALEAAMRDRYDIVLLDCRMPVLDGLAAARVIRTLEQDRWLPIIAVTANSTKEERARCRAAGMDDMLCKPFTRAQLLDALETWIARVHGPESTPEA